MQCAHCATPVPDDARFCHACGSLVSDADGQARASGAMSPDSFDKIEELLRRETAGDYDIERMLGKGGMAVVYLAREVHLARHVAIKVLPPELTFGHGVERFKREAKTAAALDHPNIIPIYRVSTSGTLFWYAMKFLEGQSLEQVLKDSGKIPLELTLKILRQVADALDYAHEHQVVHRDMKPANVMLDSRNRVIVTDFGIAKALTEGTLTASGSVIGTPYFMSPEQGMGKVVTGASDQYSVGVMAYRMLAGHVPFEGSSAIDVLHKHCMVQPPPLETAAPDLPRHVYLAVHRALDKSPDRRFASVHAFVEAMSDPTASASPAISLGGTGEGDATLVVPAQGVSAADLATTPMPSMARSTPGLSRSDAGAATPATPQTIPPRPIAPRPVPKKKGAPIGLIAAALIVVGGGATGAWYFLAGPGAHRPPATQVQAGPRQRVVQGPPQPAQPPAGQQGTPASADTATKSPVQAETLPARPVTPAPQQPRDVTPAAPKPGRLIVVGMPAGGTIVVDNQVKPGSQVDLSPGRHSVRLIHPSYEPQTTSVNVRAGDATTLEFTANPIAQRPTAPVQPPAQQPQAQPAQPSVGALQGMLRIGINVIAEVIVDQESRGRKRLFQEILLAGDHLVLLRADGFADTTLRVRVTEGDTTTYKVDLQRK